MVVNQVYGHLASRHIFLLMVNSNDKITTAFSDTDIIILDAENPKRDFGVSLMAERIIFNLRRQLFDRAMRQSCTAAAVVNIFMLSQLARGIDISYRIVHAEHLYVR